MTRVDVVKPCVGGKSGRMPDLTGLNKQFERQVRKGFRERVRCGAKGLQAVSIVGTKRNLKRRSGGTNNDRWKCLDEACNGCDGNGGLRDRCVVMEVIDKCCGDQRHIDGEEDGVTGI